MFLQKGNGFQCFGKSSLEICGRAFRGSHLPQQGPGVFTQVGADGSQQECLLLNKLEHEISVHALDGQLSVFILLCLKGNKNFKQT